jgi:hypothetical protein
MELPKDIIKQVTKDNWEAMFDEYMVVETDEGVKYVWTPEIMKEFISKLIK